MSGACSAIADQKFVFPWRQSIAKLIQVRQDRSIKHFLNYLFAFKVTSAGKLLQRLSQKI